MTTEDQDYYIIKRVELDTETPFLKRLASLIEGFHTISDLL